MVIWRLAKHFCLEISPSRTPVTGENEEAKMSVKNCLSVTKWSRAFERTFVEPNTSSLSQSLVNLPATHTKRKCLLPWNHFCKELTQLFIPMDGISNEKRTTTGVTSICCLRKNQFIVMGRPTSCRYGKLTLYSDFKVYRFMSSNVRKIFTTDVPEIVQRNADITCVGICRKICYIKYR